MAYNMFFSETPERVAHHGGAAMIHDEADGAEMGVLVDGTPYLTARALASICGVTVHDITTLLEEWTRPRPTRRVRAIAGILEAHGTARDGLSVPIQVRGRTVHAIYDAACMAILEYYAFESRAESKLLAQQSYRLLARQSLARFIHDRVGDLHRARPAEPWQRLHERVMLNPVPPGYFCMLREIIDILIPAVHAGLDLGPHTLPDVSVGIAWSKHWSEHDLDAVHGPRRKHPHRFPHGYPQSEVVEMWIYPVAAVGAFRAWMRDDYVPHVLPRYLHTKARGGALPSYRVDRLLASVSA